MKRVLKILLALVVVVLLAGGGFVFFQTRAFDNSMDKTYDVAPLAITRQSDPLVLARGKHLLEAVSICNAKGCHGGDLAGGETIAMGPVAQLTGPNITPGGLGAAYSDGEIARLVRHGIKKDGKSVRFMPAHEFGWLPDNDLTALVSYLRTVPAVDRPNGPTQVKTLGKVLDRQDKLVFDVARRVDHAKPDLGGQPEATANYGRHLAKACMGCHGETYGGGPIPGAPSNLPVPLNITTDATGLKDWSYEEFVTLFKTGKRKNGKQLDPFMPIEGFSKMDDTELKALWAFLRTVPPKPFGQR